MAPVPRTHVITVRLNDDEHHRLIATAHCEDLTLTQVVRRLIHIHLDPITPPTESADTRQESPE